MSLETQSKYLLNMPTTRYRLNREQVKENENVQPRQECFETGATPVRICTLKLVYMIFKGEQG